MSAIPLAAHLSWNSARLIALILNALTGLLQYYEHEQLDVDALVALRFIQDHTTALNLRLDEQTRHREIRQTMLNISHSAGALVDRALQHDQTGGGWEAFLVEGKYLHVRPYNQDVMEHRRLDETLRWHVKDLKDRDREHETSSWFGDESDLKDCLAQVNREKCEIFTAHPVCLSRLLLRSGTIGYAITRPILFTLLTGSLGCSSQLDHYLLARGYNNSVAFAAERCMNTHDETLPFRREWKELSRLNVQALDLLMEQVLVCGSYGFVEFASPHLLITALTWQHPLLGCLTRSKPEPIPNMGLSGNDALYDADQTPEGRDQSSNDDCHMRTSTVTAMALTVFLRFLLEPGPWPEFHFADQLVHLEHSISSEDRFARFNYVNWVWDANFPPELRRMPPRPPVVSWSPDLLAFMAMLFLLCVGSVLASYIYTEGGGERRRFGGTKRLYPYAFKKL